MIRNHYLIPECYVMKIPYCDECELKLADTNRRLMTSPPQVVLECPRCGKEYHYYENELQGEWKWRTM